MAHIGIDARLVYYRQGGISQYIYHLIRELPTVDPENQHTIIHSRKDKRNLAEGHNQRRVMAWTPAHHRIERLALAVEMYPHNFDLMHSPDFIPPIPLRGHSIITVHDLTFLHYPEFLTADSRRYYNGQIRQAVEVASHVLADSEATRQDIIAMLNVPEDKITTIWLGISDHFQPAEAEEVRSFKERHQLPEHYILFVGTLEPRKNLPGLFDAYAQLMRQQPDLPGLVIVGQTGWLADDLHALSITLNIADAVTWRADIPYNDLPALYSGAELLCLPSHYEGFGFPPLEAMACGTPVVVANRASLPEIVGDAGVLVDPDDSEAIASGIERLLNDRAFASDLVQKGFERVKAFNWQQTAEKTATIYHRVLGTT